MLARLPRIAEYPKLTLPSCLRGAAHGGRCSLASQASTRKPAAGRCAQARLQSPPVVAPDLLLRLGPDASPCSVFLLEPMMLMWVSSGGGRRFVPMQLPVVANPPMSSGLPGFPIHIHEHDSMRVRRAALPHSNYSQARPHASGLLLAFARYGSCPWAQDRTVAPYGPSKVASQGKQKQPD